MTLIIVDQRKADLPHKKLLLVVTPHPSSFGDHRTGILLLDMAGNSGEPNYIV